jgi:hypothetical protein
MYCTVVGPNFSIITLNVVDGTDTGSVDSYPINAKSEFTVSCSDQATGFKQSVPTYVEVAGTIEET